MDYYYTGILVPIVGLVIYNISSITNYVIKALNYAPGEGEIYKKVNPRLKTTNYFIKNPDHGYRLNYLKKPNFDMSVYYFADNLDFEDNFFIHQDDFCKKYGKMQKIRLPEHGMGIIEDVYYTENFKRGPIYGCITSLTEDMIFMFKINEGQIDLKNIFYTYETEIEGM